MSKIISIKFRNIGPYGNKETFLEFPDSPVMMQLLGTNGWGKSSLIRAIKLAAYGETEGIMLSDIANDINGNGYTRIAIEDKGVYWEIERGFSPNYVKVYKDSNIIPEDFGDLNATRAKIRNQILSIPFQIFDNTLSLSINDFKSFMTMKPTDSKSIRDRIFSLYVVNEIYSEVNTEINILEKDLESSDKIIDATKQQYEDIKASYDDMKTRIKDEINSRIADIDSEIPVLDSKLKELEGVLDGHKKMLEAYTDDLEWYNYTEILENNRAIAGKIASLEISVAQAETEIAEYETGIRKINEDKALYVHYQQYLASEEAKTKAKEYELRDKVNTFRLTALNHFRTISLEANLLAEKENITTTLAADEPKAITTAQNLEKAGQTRDKANVIIATTNSRIDEIKKKIELMDAGKCAECGATQDAHLHGKTKEEFEIELTELGVKLNTIVVSHSKAVAYIPSASTWMNAYRTKKGKLEHQLEEIDKRLAGIKYDVPKKDTPKYHAVIEKYDAQLLEAKTPAEFDAKIAELSSNSTKLSNLISGYKAKILEGDPIAEVQPFDQEKLATLESSLKSANARYRALQTEISNNRANIKQQEAPAYHPAQPELSKEQLQAEITNVKADIDSISTIEIPAIKGDIRVLDLEKNRLLAENIDNKLKSMHDSVMKLERDLKNAIDNTATRREEMKYKKLFRMSLSDEGIKSYIFRESTPFINNQIQDILVSFDINLNLYFDEEFQAHIFRNGKEVSVKTISVGQKKILDFAILIAITKILKLKYPSINLIFYDEIFSSIHPTNRVTILDIIDKEIRQKLGMNVIVVSHSHLPEAYFEKYIEVYRDTNFSCLRVMTAEDYLTSEKTA
jgi:DNA repair exonuclease SbcCD ATPase subunit